MIQELLGAVVEERKLNTVPRSFLVDVSSPTTSSSSPSQSAAASSPSSASASSENLRCPRCDSSNTKFCYYNNYNLTQPRHFCKTCRRYWTKGGALRNVPIGGGCRKTKAAATASVIGTKFARPMAADLVIGPMGRTGSGRGAHGHILDHDNILLPSSPLLWASCSIPHSSHLLPLLRASQEQQQSRSPHNLLDYCVKEELGDAVSLDHSMSNILYNNNNNNSSSLMHQYQQQQSQNLFLADTPTSSGIQELYQRLLAPANCGGSDINQQHVMIGGNNGNNVGVLGSSATATAAAASVMEPIPLMSGPGEFGYWNPAGLSWADHLSTANGAFP